MDRQEIKARGETEHLPAEDAVSVSDEWYRAIYDGSPLAMTVWDTERRVVDWNRQAETVFGWTREEVLGKDFFSFLLPASVLPTVAGVVDALLAGNLPSRSINENRTKRGETILCEWNNSIQRDSQGKVTGVISLALDITKQKRDEDALRLFKESVENASDAVGMSTPEGKHYYQNKAFDELFGAIGENPPETLYVVPAVGHEVFRTIMAGGQWAGEVQMYARDRKVLTILLRAYASKDQSGRITGLVGVHTDITERKKAEQALDRERSLYKDLVVSQPSGVYRLRIKAQNPWGESEWVDRVGSNYKLELVSDKFCAILGATREQCEASASIVVDRIHPDDRPGFVAGNVLALKTLETFKWEGRLKVGDKVVWSHFVSVPRRLDDGDVIWTGIVMDITERKQAEVALQNSQEDQRTLIAALPDVIMRFDSECRHLFASENVEQVTGFPAAAFIGKTHHEIGFPEHMCELWEHAIRQPFLTGMIYETEFDIDSPSGRITFNWRLTPDIDDTGHVRSVLAIARDITEQKRLERERCEFDARMQQAQRLESLGVLAGGIAHDFNNILAAIMGNAELALDDISPLSPGRERLEGIVTASKRAAGLCAQMLAYAGRSRIEKRNIALGDLVEETLHLLKTSISKKAILNLNLEKSLPCMLGDPAQIRQILMNLVINASEAIGERSGVIALSTGAMDCSGQHLTNGYIVAPDKPGTYVYIEVSDTGCGMDKDAVQRIFEPFFTTKFTGRGLGLSAVLGIVKAHEGALRVYSEPGKGSTFKVLFPAIDVAEDREPEHDANRDWHGSGTVLLVDDEESIRAMSSQQLRRLGLQVLTAEDGRQAVNLYCERKDAIALVLLDLTMPQLNGEEAFRELRQINPNVRVILVSGYSEDDIAARFAGKGLAGCLQKPYTVDRLRSLLSTLLPKAEQTTRSEEGKCPNKGVQTDG
jgi:PAS domain S-box-containing protein